MLSRDDVIRMAKQAGGYHAGEFHGRIEAMERFAAAAYAAGAAAEREACAQACESTVWTATIPEWRDMTKRDIAARSMTACAAAIRQRAAYRTLTPQELAAAGRNAGYPMPSDPPKMGQIPESLRPCRCGTDGCSDSACPGRCAPVSGNVPMHITGPDGRSLRVQRSYWHEGVLCVVTDAWPEPRTMTDEDMADCGLLSELD